MDLQVSLLMIALIPIINGIEVITPVGHSVQLKIYSLNNWAIPANPDKEERLRGLITVLRNESYDLFLLQGLWMEYDHAAIQAALPKDLNITLFRELGSSTMCDGRITRAGCSGLSIVYRNKDVTKLSSSFHLYSYRGSIFTTDGTLGKGVGRLRLKIKSVVVDIFVSHVHDTELYYQDLQATELMSVVTKSPSDLVILAVSLQSIPSEKPYRDIVTYNPSMRVMNTAQVFDPLKWNDPTVHGTYNMPNNNYTVNGTMPSIRDYIFAYSPLKYDISIEDFFTPTFSSLSKFNVSLSNHETLGLDIGTTI